VLEFEDADAIVDFGLEVLQDLKSQGVVVGVLNTNPD
jgi:hypothetical protein